MYTARYHAHCCSLCAPASQAASAPPLRIRSDPGLLSTMPTFSASSSQASVHVWKVPHVQMRHCAPGAMNSAATRSSALVRRLIFCRVRRVHLVKQHRRLAGANNWAENFKGAHADKWAENIGAAHAVATFLLHQIKLTERRKSKQRCLPPRTMSEASRRPVRERCSGSHP